VQLQPRLHFFGRSFEPEFYIETVHFYRKIPKTVQVLIMFRPSGPSGRGSGPHIKKEKQTRKKKIQS
jgi:hypothetical protein